MKDFEKECQERANSIAKHLNALAGGKVGKDDECQSLYDYFDDVYDIEYRIDGSGKYRSVRLMIACGGPDIYVDTDDSYVKLYWGNAQVSAPISYDTSDAIDDIFQEYYTCISNR